MFTSPAAASAISYIVTVVTTRDSGRREQSASVHQSLDTAYERLLSAKRAGADFGDVTDSDGHLVMWF